MKKILKIGIYLLLITSTLLLLSFSRTKKSNSSVNSPNIVIKASEHQFVTNEYILELLKNKGYHFNQQNISEINISEIEKILKNEFTVRDVNVYLDIENILHIYINQRNPIVRIFNKNGQSFYLDSDGKIMPLSSEYTARILVVNGNINEKQNLPSVHEIITNDSLNKASKLPEVFEVANIINKSTFWKAQIEQIYINQDSEFEIIPKIGMHRIMMGNTSGFEQKLNKLKIFYEKGIKPTQWNLYDTINLKYNNQIICTKSEIK